MKRTLSIFLALTLLVFTVFPAFARGYGGGTSSSRGFSSSRSFSSGLSSRSSFTSTRGLSTNYSRGMSSTPNFSFTKSTPKTVSFTRPVVTRPTVSTTSTTPYRYIKSTPTRVVNRTTVVNHYDNGAGVSNLVTNMLLLHALTSNNNKSTSFSKADLMNTRNAMLKCYDQGGGRSCITNYL